MKKRVDQRVGHWQFSLVCGGLYAAWRWKYSVYDDGSESEDFWEMGALFRPAMPWEKEDMQIEENGMYSSARKLMEVRE